MNLFTVLALFKVSFELHEKFKAMKLVKKGNGDVTKITIIGAGSQFGTRLSLTLWARDTLQDSTICLWTFMQNGSRK